MSTFFSFVGMQPGAVATTTKTMILHSGITHILLFPTLKTESIANRLIDFIRHLKPDIVIDLYVIDDFKTEKKSTWEAISIIINSNECPGPFYFDTSPGLNYQVAQTSLYLKEKQPDVIPLYADDTFLHFIGKDHSLQLENIGLEELLKLYQLKKSIGESPLGETEPYIKIKSKDREFTFLDLREYHGRLHVATEIIFEKQIKGTKEEDSEKELTKYQARDIYTLLKTTKKMNNLHPIVNVLTNYDLIKRRLTPFFQKNDLNVHFVGAQINNNEDKKNFIKKNISKIWENKTNPKKNKTNNSGVKDHIMRFTKGVIKLKSSGKWKKTNLILNLGSDPASTLLAIFTHKPEELIILVDQNTPIVCANAEKLKFHKSLILSKNIYFWPTDITGNIQFKDKLLEKLSKGKWIGNITPGTKAQAWRLARLTNTHAWSLNNFQNRSESLISSQDQYEKYQLPPIIAQTMIQQNEPMFYKIADAWADKFPESLISKNYHGLSLNDIKKKKDFLFNVAGVVAAISQNKNGYFPFTNWKKGIQLPQYKKKYYLKCLNVNLSNEEIHFEVFYHKQKSRGVLHGTPKGGHWLEEVVAGAFLKACRKDDIPDLHVGIVWPWFGQDPGTYPNQRKKFFRTELDVVLIWRKHYVCISCKLGKNEEKLKDIHSEIIGEARECFGRFALPVLVRGGISGKKAYSHALDTMDKEPLEISLCLLNRPDELKNLLDLAIRKKSTSTN